VKPWVTQKELCELMGLKERQVATLCARPGAPQKRQGTKWVYAWPGFVRWYGDERERAGRDKARPATEDEARKRKLAAEAELAELDLATQRKELMTVEQFDKLVSETFARVAAQLKTAPTKYAPDVLGVKTLPEAVARLDTVFRDALDELFRDGGTEDDDDPDSNR
jgi:phage terminase Nu1 subunit (DNA packaging protein)